MPSSRPTRRRRVERREVRAARRARNFALLARPGDRARCRAAPHRLRRRHEPRDAARGDGARRERRRRSRSRRSSRCRGAVRLQMPIAQSLVTAIGYHAADDGAIALAPVGRQGNEGLVQRAVPRRSSAAAADTRPGTSSAAARRRRSTSARRPAPTSTRPSTARSSASRRTSIGGRRYGSRIDIQPQNAPSLVVSLTQLRADPSLTVGASVIGGATRLGSDRRSRPHREAGARPLHERRRQPRHGRAPARGDAGPAAESPLPRRRLRRRGAACGRRAAARRCARSSASTSASSTARTSPTARGITRQARRQAARRGRRRRHAREPHLSDATGSAPTSPRASA